MLLCGVRVTVLISCYLNNYRFVMMTLACSPVDCQLSDSVSEGTDNTDTTGYSSDEDWPAAAAAMFSLVNPMIVVSNRLPFVLRRDKAGNLERKPR